MTPEPTTERPGSLRDRLARRDRSRHPDRFPEEHPEERLDRSAAADDAAEFAFSTEIDPDAHADEKHRSAEVVSRNLLSLFDFDC